MAKKQAKQVFEKADKDKVGQRTSYVKAAALFSVSVLDAVKLYWKREATTK